MTEPRRYVCRASDPQWLSERKKVVTGSEIAVVMGLSPWKTREALLAEKLAPDVPIVSRHMWWGSHSEKSNMEAFTKLTGLRTRGTNRFWVRGELGATIDGFLTTENPRAPLEPCWSPAYRMLGDQLKWVTHVDTRRPLGLVEMKQTEAYRAKEWAKGVPTYYLYQAQAQMFVTGLTWCVVACRLGAADMICHVLEFDAELAQEMQDAAREFMAEVNQERGSV
jgi:putative phage-type endonuclease